MNSDISIFWYLPVVFSIIFLVSFFIYCFVDKYMSSYVVANLIIGGIVAFFAFISVLSFFIWSLFGLFLGV